jgi:hypothetical protein
MKWAGDGGAISTSSPAHFIENNRVSRGLPLVGVEGAKPLALLAYCAIQPPSTTSSVPVTNDASSEARNSTA